MLLAIALLIGLGFLGQMLKFWLAGLYAGFRLGAVGVLLALLVIWLVALRPTAGPGR
jgi:hypothetical protein